MTYIWVLLPWLFANMSLIVSNEVLSREKRSYFIYPMGGQFKLVIGLAIPVKLGIKQSMAYGLNLQFQYAEPTNASQIVEYPPTISGARKKRDGSTNDRAVAYLGLELIMERYGINGRACLLRTICENAVESLHHDANGLYGHLLHIFFTPDYGDTSAGTDFDPAYLEAQNAGRYGVHCNSLYPDCPYGHGIFDFVGFTDDELSSCFNFIEF